MSELNQNPVDRKCPRVRTLGSETPASPVPHCVKTFCNSDSLCLGKVPLKCAQSLQEVHTLCTCLCQTVWLSFHDYCNHQVYKRCNDNSNLSDSEQSYPICWGPLCSQRPVALTFGCCQLFLHDLHVSQRPCQPESVKRQLQDGCSNADSSSIFFKSFCRIKVCRKTWMHGDAQFYTRKSKVPEVLSAISTFKHGLLTTHWSSVLQT